MIGLRAQAGLLFVEADSEFTFSGDPKDLCAKNRGIAAAGEALLSVSIQAPPERAAMGRVAQLE